jgi:hypothetical protein
VLPWSIMVLLPKPDGSSQGIGLLEVIWKLLMSIIDGQLKAAISFHDALHGFRPGRGRRWVECSICGLNLAASSLASHTRTVHGMVPSGDVGRADAPGCQPAEYRVSFPKILTRVSRPVEGCPGQATSWPNLRQHFTHRHPRDVIVILEEGRLPKCKLCGMHVLMGALAGGHQ